MSIIVINRLARKGKPWPHRHKWIPLNDHPRRGDVCVCFMLEAEERLNIEMCSTCSGRRPKPVNYCRNCKFYKNSIIDDRGPKCRNKNRKEREWTKAVACSGYVRKWYKFWLKNEEQE